MSVLNLFIIFGAKYLIALPVVVLIAYYFFGDVNKRHLLWLSVISLPLTYLLGKIVGIFYFDPLPFVVGNFTPLIAHAADNGFPSDHILLAGAIAAAVTRFNRPLGLSLWAVAALISISRILAGVHHPIDVLAAALIALAAVYLTEYVLSHFFLDNTPLE